MSTPVLGIMALYWGNRKRFEEWPFFRKMISLGKKLGLDVFVFSPEDVDHKRKRVYAHLYDVGSGKWRRGWKPFPPLILDRCRYQPTARFQQLRQFRKQYPKLSYLNYPLANKWIMHQVLHKNHSIRSHLPQTALYESSRNVFDMIRKHRVIFVKPINGTGGRGVMRIKAIPGGKYLIQGRSLQRTILRTQKLTRTQLTAMLGAKPVKSKYLVQQGIPIRLDNGRVHDYRMLIQKNNAGEWEITGCAARIGPKNSVTSNIHGGGRAARMDDVLRTVFTSESRIASIKKTAEQLARDVAEYTEREFNRLAELALDLAIDRSGHIWLLEINPKPGREVFGKVADRETYRKAHTRLLDYALWLHKQEEEAP